MKLRKINGTYHVCFDAEDGTPMKVDTGCKDFKKAKKIAWQTKTAELEQVAKVTHLTNEIVSRIVSGKEITMEIALGRFVAIIFSTNDSILGWAMSKINRDK